MKTVNHPRHILLRTGHRLARLLPVTLALALVSVGCGKVAAERAENQALAQAAAAIEHYSKASDEANAAHKKVMAAFATANAKTSLAEYQRALDEDVAPALEAFIKQLEAMPTETAELKAIHGDLVKAYTFAKNSIRDFSKNLKGPDELKDFEAIRAALQEAVKTYQTRLKAYYAKNQRQLRLDGRPQVDAVATAAAATPSATPSAAPARRAASVTAP